MRLTVLAIALALAPQAFAQTGDEATALRDAVERGRLLYAYDQAAWHGTDDMIAKVGNPQNLVGGWIVDGPADAAQLVFYDKDIADPHVVYVASFTSGKLLSSRVLGPGDDRSLTVSRKRMIAAVRSANAVLAASKVGPCSGQAFNTVVLPPAGPDSPVSVYYLTPQSDMTSLPFGGHYRIDVSPDGKPGPVRAFSKACIPVPTNAPVNGNGPAKWLFITHLLDPVPTEIHVFSSLAAGKPVYVATSATRVWAVDGDRSIRCLDPGRK